MLRGVIDRFVGRGEAAVTVPPMDGALRPNQALERASVAAEVRAPDNLVSYRGDVLFSSGHELRALGSRRQQTGLRLGRVDPARRRAPSVG